MTFIPLLISIIGAFVYVFGESQPKLQELGRIAFAVGLLAFLLTYKF